VATDPASVPVHRVRWQTAWRLVPSRFPAVGPWDRIAAPADFEALAHLEGMTNPRLREEMGVLAMTPRERWISGPGSTPTMAAFTHLNAEGSRFSDGSFGVFYASRALETAIRETVYHRERFLARTHEPPLQVQMRSYQCTLQGNFHDLRGGYPAEHHPDDYRASQRLAGVLRASGANGIVYDSVRHPGGNCAAVFWPDKVGPCRTTRHYAYHWDGTAIRDVLELRALTLE
jgi:hypothetical protein